MRTVAIEATIPPPWNSTAIPLVLACSTSLMTSKPDTTLPPGEKRSTRMV